MTLTSLHFAALSPILLVSATIVIVMLAIAFKRHHRGTATLSVLGLNLALIARSEEHTSELQSLMRSSYAVLCLKNKNCRYHDSRHSNQTDLVTQHSIIPRVTTQYH